MNGITCGDGERREGEHRNNPAKGVSLTQGKTGYWQRSLKLRPARVLSPMRYSKLLMRRRCQAFRRRPASSASDMADGRYSEVPRQSSHIKQQ